MSITNCSRSGTGDLTTGSSPYIERCNADGSIYVSQPYALYSQSNHATWEALNARLAGLWPRRACKAHLRGIELLKLPSDRVPVIAEVNAVLARSTKVCAVPVVGFLPMTEFFESLFAGHFPATITVRPPEQLDFTADPDLAHDALGHFAMLADRDYAAYIRLLGTSALIAREVARSEPTLLRQRSRLERAYQALSRLAWFTIEVGLIDESEGIRVFGGALLSSSSDLVSATESADVVRAPFDLDAVINQPYDYSALQKHLFVLRSLSDLRSAASGLLARIFQDTLPPVEGPPLLADNEAQDLLSAASEGRDACAR